MFCFLPALEESADLDPAGEEERCRFKWALPFVGSAILVWEVQRGDR